MITIDEARKKQLRELVPIYKKAFAQHNIFENNEKLVLAYLKKTHADDSDFGSGYIVAMLDDPIMKIQEKVIGGMLIAFKGISPKGHIRLQLKHLAVDPRYQGIGAATDLITYALDKAYAAAKNGTCSSAKIEVRVAENEKSLHLFKKLGFKEEGRLRDYYRLGETCHFLGMLIK